MVRMLKEDCEIVTQFLIELFAQFGFKCDETYSISLVKFYQRGEVIFCHIYPDHVSCNWYPRWTANAVPVCSGLRLVLFLADSDNQVKVNEFIQQTRQSQAQTTASNG